MSDHSCIGGRVPLTCLDCAGSPGRGTPCATCHNKGFNLFRCPRCYPNHPDKADFSVMGGGDEADNHLPRHHHHGGGAGAGSGSGRSGEQNPHGGFLGLGRWGHGGGGSGAGGAGGAAAGVGFGV